MNKVSGFPYFAGKQLPAELQELCNNHLHSHFHRQKKEQANTFLRAS
jgi:hypothetical protein